MCRVFFSASRRMMAGLADVAARPPRVAGADDVRGRRVDQGPVQLLVLPDERVPVRRPHGARAGSVLM